MQPVFQTPVRSPSRWLGVFSTPPRAGGPDRPVAAMEDPIEWGRRELHRTVFQPILRATTPGALDKKLARLLPRCRAVMEILVGAIEGGSRPPPTHGGVKSVVQRRAAAIESAGDDWSPRAAAFLRKAGEIQEVSLEMLSMAAAGHGGVIRTSSLQQRAAFLDAADRLELLMMAVETAPEYGRRTPAPLRMRTAVANRLAFLTWEAAMRYHAQISSLVSEEIREQAVTRLQIREAELGRRIDLALARLPRQKSAAYRRFLGGARPTEREIDDIVRKACSAGRH
jgi:hypothetical protein